MSDMVNGRISRNNMLMSIADIVAERSTCSRLHVGAVISRNGRIISTGYNGVPAGMPHCEHWDDEPHTGCTDAEHAERNAIAHSAKFGIATEGSELHVTHMPCISCARMIVNAGIVKVYYGFSYRLTDGVELLKAAGIEVVDFRAGD